MIAGAIISGSLRRALYRDDRGTWVLTEHQAEPIAAAPGDLASFHHVAIDLTYADPEGLPISNEQLRLRLEKEIDFVDGLDGLLVGMDPDFSEEVRKDAIRNAETILAADPVLARRIRTRFLIPANSQEWDPAQAQDLAQAAGAIEAASTYELLADGTVERIVDDLGQLIGAHFGGGIEAETRRKAFLDSGLVADLCAALKNRPTLLGLPFRIHEFPEIRAIDPGGKVLTGLVKHLASQPSEDISGVTPLGDDGFEWDEDQGDPLVAAALRAAELQAERRRKGYRLLDHDLEAIQREIAWIGERLRVGEVTRAEGALIRLLEDQAPRSKPEHIVKTLTGVADQARRLKKFDFATRLLDAADFLEARDSAVMCVRGELLREVGRTDEALAMFRETMERFPNDEVAPTAYAETLRQVGRADEALAKFRETIERFPYNAVARNAYAETLREVGRTDEALAMFRETMERFPHDEVVPNAYAETLREVGRTDEALAMFRETMERFPRDEVAPNAYAKTLRQVGRTDEALAVFRETMERFPHNAVAPTAYAETLREVGRTDEALVVFRETMERFAHNEVAPTAYAETLREVGRTDEALAMFRETMERFPHNAVARNAYAETLREVGRTDEALAMFLETMERFPHNEVAPTAYAETLREVGRTDEALAMFRKAIEGFQRNEVAPTAYAEMLREVGRTDEALAMFRETRERFPNNEVTRNAYANLLIAEGKIRDGEALLAKAVERLQPRNDWIALHILAMGHLRRGSTSTALEMLRNGLNNCPFAEQVRYFRSALALALIMDRRAKEALAELESAIQQTTSKPQAATVRLVRAHALGECGQEEATHVEISDIKRQFALSARQNKLAEMLLVKYVSGPIPGGGALAASNDNIYRLEIELMTSFIDRGTMALRRAA